MNATLKLAWIACAWLCVFGTPVAEAQDREGVAARSAPVATSDSGERQLRPAADRPAPTVNPPVVAEKRKPYIREVSPGKTCCAYCEQINAQGNCSVWSQCLHGVTKCEAWKVE